MTNVPQHIGHFLKYRILSKLLRAFLSCIPVKTYSKIIIGAADTGQNGFLSTDIDLLDVTKPKDWSKLFYKGKLTNIVAEHVFEHLSHKECLRAFMLCYEYLDHGGVLRIAVPDKYRKDLAYVREVKPPADGHKSYFGFDDLSNMLENVGFKTKKLEWHDKRGVFHHTAYSKAHGKISRSLANDRQSKFKVDGHYYTSLIIDAIK